MTRMRLHFVVCLVLLCIGGCIPQQSLEKPVLVDEGEVLLYLQPVPQESQKLRLTINRISAVGADGLEVALDLSFTELRGGDLTGRQRLLATAILPPGSYTGISIEVEKATVQTAEGEMALFIPGEPVMAQHLFKVVQRQASALFLSLNPSGLVTGGISFTPSFSLTGSTRPLINFRGYVSNSDSNLITVFDKKSMLVVDAIATGKGPKGVALDQRRTKAYVALSGEDAVGVLDVVSGSFIGRIGLSFGDNPIELALTPDGRTLLSVNHNSNTVSLIDAFSMFEITKIRVGERPTSAVIDPAGFKAYVLNSGSSTVSVVDLTQRAVAVTISVESAPLRGAFNPQGNRLYVIGRESSNLTVIDPSRFAVVQKIFVGMGAASIKVNPLTGLILVGKRFGGQITVVDPSTAIFVDTIEVEGSAAFMTIDRAENTLFVVLPDKRKLQKINLTSRKTTAEIEVVNGAYGVVVMGES